MDGSHQWTEKAAAGVAGAVLLASAVGGAAAVGAADLTDRLMIEKGREVFLAAGGVGCVTCHGHYAEGNAGIGGFNRGASEEAIRTALIMEEPMEFLRDEISSAQIKQLAAYTRWLGQMRLIKSLASGGRFVPDRLEVHPGTRVQLVVINADPQPHTFTSDGLGFSKVTVGGSDDVAVVWVAPESEGTFAVACADCGPQGQRLTIAVTTKAAKFDPATAAHKARATAGPAAPPEPDLTPSERALAAKGRDLFLNAGGVGCAGCHGRYAEGDAGIGSYNRGFSEDAIRRALKTVGPMAFLADELGEAEIKEIAAYYKSLGQMRLVKTMVVQGLLVPDSVRIHPGTKVQLVVINGGHVPRTFASGTMRLERFTVPGQQAADLTWTAPNYRSWFSLVCIDCRTRGQQLTVEVTDEVPPYAPPVALK